MSTFDYRRYLASREWAVRKKAVRDRSGGLCERCLMDVMSVVHHLTYEHIGNEPLEDLQGLCRGCHEFLSAETDIDPADRVIGPSSFAALVQAGIPRPRVEQAVRRCAQWFADSRVMVADGVEELARHWIKELYG